MAASRIPNLKKLRTERLLTQAQLGEAIGISPRTLIRWEAGDGEPATTDLVSIARFFGVSLDQLVSDLTSSETPSPLPKVADLSGGQLDYWIAKVQGMAVEMTGNGPVLYEPGYGQRPVPRYSSDLSLATHLMQSTNTQLQSLPAGAKFDGARKSIEGWVARCAESPIACWGMTIPEAGMRAYLSSMVGFHVLMAPIVASD
ncbi:helix-turn-helix domain-containing protein [Variovorax sp. RB3P1]|uniref:helix-turn-helix domain-containing protein n=1 Tax=Variovorax sp. RB3P1 TaxID=3443732 RepID=UPI003F48ECE7